MSNRFVGHKCSKRILLIRINFTIEEKKHWMRIYWFYSVRRAFNVNRFRAQMSRFRRDCRIVCSVLQTTILFSSNRKQQFECVNLIGNGETHACCVIQNERAMKLISSIVTRRWLAVRRGSTETNATQSHFKLVSIFFAQNLDPLSSARPGRKSQSAQSEQWFR